MKIKYTFLLLCTCITCACEAPTFRHIEDNQASHIPAPTTETAIYHRQWEKEKADNAKRTGRPTPPPIYRGSSRGRLF